MELASGDLDKAVNRGRYFEKDAAEALQIISARQSHSANAIRVINQQPQIIEADGLVTQIPGLFLTVTVADCFPVYFFDPNSKTIAIAHTGWRGTVGGIAIETVEKISNNRENIIAGIGPGIQACHFEIKDDVVKKFAEYPEAVIYRDGKIYVDLPQIIARQLIKAGLKTQNIETCGECTFCLKEKYFSFRRDKPESVEAMVAYIGVL